jgi:hypothetical protein
VHFLNQPKESLHFLYEIPEQGVIVWTDRPVGLFFNHMVRVRQEDLSCALSVNLFWRYLLKPITVEIRRR